MLYVDDIFLTVIQLASIQELKNNLKNKFEMAYLGILLYFLGLYIWHMADGIFLSQPKYVTYLLPWIHMSDCKPSPMPFQSRVKLILVSPNPLVDATLYHHVINGLIYLTHIRPNISFFISMGLRFMKNPHESH